MYIMLEHWVCIYIGITSNKIYVYCVATVWHGVCTGGGTGDSHSLLCNTFVFLAASSKDLHHTGSYKSLHPHTDKYHSNVHVHYVNTKAVLYACL